MVSSNLGLLLCGVTCLGLVCWVVLQPSPDSGWYHIALLLQVAALTGLLLRGLRRKVFFANGLSLHQSPSLLNVY